MGVAVPRSGWRRSGASWAAGRGEEAPDVQICLELHAGAAAYNPASYLRIAEAGGDAVRVNFDPSHFWWQGIDPLRVIEQLGDRIGFCHGKDTLLHADRIAPDGVIDMRFPVDPDTATWHFAAVGERPRHARVGGAAAALRDGWLRRRRLDRARGSAPRTPRTASSPRWRRCGPRSERRRPAA